MLNDPGLQELQQLATDFRAAIERSRADKATPQLPYFPEGACKIVSALLALHLRRRGGNPAIKFVTGHVPGFDAVVRHAWLVVNGAVVDITADPFGEAPVVVGPPTRFHNSLDEREERDASTVIAAFSETEAARYHRLLGPIEARLGPQPQLSA
jgi:hypothetical protein